ncbi:AgmX/PglI C-terminal domain-containing protein [Pyxidicoccus trucidator]|uniref:AgmX/PglI C-terminal domain-containing protein n=1 Tax=Pyxidicoccus trucidator TaxID=2709662 RepID=UPI0013D9C169|nr:AgmX/PglI C-terminal domain-containing protein [Pyxidicoccus trucidator]
MRSLPLLLMMLSGSACTPRQSSMPVPLREELNKDAIQEVLAAHRPEIRACYEQTIRTRGFTPEGRLVVGFVIEADGAVRESRLVSATTDSPMLERCVLERVATWTFPRPQSNGRVSVHYPYVFVQAPPETPKQAPAPTQ